MSNDTLDREYDAKDPVEMREFDAALMAALVPVRDYYRDKIFAPSHPKIWLRIAEHGDPENDQVRLRIVPRKSQPPMVVIRLIHRNGTETSIEVNGMDLMQEGRP
jgi:hypothetical protein